MSIIASVKVYDGLAIAADSMTQILGVESESGPIGVVKQYQYARKIFQLSDLTIAVATYGIGNIGSRSIESLLLEFSKLYVNHFGQAKSLAINIKDNTETLFNFIKEKYNDAFSILNLNEKPQLGFFVGGYSTNSPFAEEWEFVFPKSEDIREVRPKEQFGASWRGVSLPFTRLFRGIDPRIEQLLKSENIEESIINKIHSAVQSPIIFDGMPIQDAIDLSKFIVSTTIGLSRFEIGPQSCGGPIDIAVVLPNGKNSGFQWIQQKSLGVTI